MRNQLLLATMDRSATIQQLANRIIINLGRLVPGILKSSFVDRILRELLN